MRQRKPRDLEEKLASHSDQIIYEPYRPGIAEYLARVGKNRNVFLEIGCGKGSFIRSKALQHPDDVFIGVEGQDTVILRALEKAEASAQELYGSSCLPNLRFVMSYVDDMSEFFPEGSLDGIYLNFSDPWPKARHAKRRLTHRKRLEDYAKSLKSGGFIEIKTDNNDLYEFTLGEIAALGYEPREKTRDLHGSEYEARLTTTEYEERYVARGERINYLKLIF